MRRLRAGMSAACFLAILAGCADERPSSPEPGDNVSWSSDLPLKRDGQAVVSFDPVAGFGGDCRFLATGSEKWLVRDNGIRIRNARFYRFSGSCHLPYPSQAVTVRAGMTPAQLRQALAPAGLPLEDYTPTVVLVGGPAPGTDLPKGFHFTEGRLTALIDWLRL